MTEQTEEQKRLTESVKKLRIIALPLHKLVTAFETLGMADVVNQLLSINNAITMETLELDSINDLLPHYNNNKLNNNWDDDIPF